MCEFAFWQVGDVAGIGHERVSGALIERGSYICDLAG